jgi:kynurenine 3-monooxygenase
MNKMPIVILGAGLAGSLLSILLKKAGFEVMVFEKRIDPRNSNIVEGRSINLALSHRGINALKYAGVYEQVAQDIIPMKGRMMHDKEGDLTFQAYGKDEQSINSISRNELNKTLISEAEALGVDFRFAYKCEKVNIDRNEIVVSNNDRYQTFEGEVIIGTDGAFSAMRKAMMTRDRFNFQQHYIEHGYKELSMPPLNGKFAMEPNYLHIWPRGNFMLIALPNPDLTFTCTLFFPFEGPVSFEQIQSSQDVSAFFKEYFGDTIPLIPDLEHQFEQNPTSSLVTLRCYPWSMNRCLIMGDAAHAIVPFYGQGMNAAFEDCRIFMEMARDMDFNWDSTSM